MLPGTADDDHQIGGGHAALGEDGAPCGARDAEVCAVDEARIEGGVGEETCDGDVQRCPCVLQSAQDTGRGKNNQHGGDTEGRDPQVGGRVRGCGVGGAEEAHDRRCRGKDDRNDSGAGRSASQMPSMP
ncbi:hypothetical protein SALBM311S_05118 [Streptomyces alboniger]